MSSFFDRTEVLRAIQQSYQHLTPLDLQRKLKQTAGLSRQRVKQAVARLVQEKEIAYTYQFGCTFLALSYDRPRRVSASIVVKPPACAFAPEPGDTVIDMKPGASFGIGQHPTTRLCLQGIEFLMRSPLRRAPGRGSAVLDVGTGSGILLIAALKMGFSQGTGLDVDPCAVMEAKENIALNGLDGRVEVSAKPAEEITSNYDLILANLRLPTLVRLAPFLRTRTKDRGHMVLSGIRTEEMSEVSSMLDNDASWNVVWRRMINGWGAVAIKKRPARH